jgi:lipid-A-disaccharide synthase
MRQFALVAGEASGDLLAGLLLDGLRARWPSLSAAGIGGPQMLARGFQTWWPQEKLAVRGYVEVLRHFREILGIRKKLRKHLTANPPDVFIGIDAPDFNLGLELALRKRGIPTIHYVSPSIWAWRGERIHKIKRAASRVLALFPFEAPLYEQVGEPVTYVGHPLADMLPEQSDRAAMREQLRIPKSATKVFALLPGSRQSEVHHLAETYIETAKLILQRIPDAQFLVPLVSRETRDLFEKTLWKLHAQDLPLTLMFGSAHAAMIAADGVLVASGTATLEAALLKRPMVITYKTPAFTFWFSKRKHYQPWVGLPNILAGRFVVPEILQNDATPENLAQALCNLVLDEGAVSEVTRVFSDMHTALKQNAARRAAEAVLPYLDGLTPKDGETC